MRSTPKFFLEKYKYVINHPNWPCLQVDNLARPTYLPMEIKDILKLTVFSTTALTNLCMIKNHELFTGLYYSQGLEI